MASTSWPKPIEPVAIDSDELAQFRTEDEYTSVAVALMIETASYCCLAAGTLGPSKVWDRNTAAVAGNVVRLYKLLDAFLDQVTKRREETAFVLARLAFETNVNVRYLARNFSPALIESYISYSLRHEKKLFETIQSNIKLRNGIIMPIEDRMIQSITRAASAAGIPLENIDLKDKRPWGGKNVFDKTKDVGLEALYLAMFGGASHGIHGNWQEIYANHLEWDGAEAFTPKMKWRTPRPQMLTSMCLVTNETLEEYFRFIGGEEVGDYFGESLQNLQNRILTFVQSHENYLGGKKWPSI